jgi:hypothetical protein
MLSYAFSGDLPVSAATIVGCGRRSDCVAGVSDGSERERGAG